MLPAPVLPTRSLAEASRDFLAGLGSSSSDSSARAAKRTIVVIDGLGADLISQHSGHARHLARALREHGEVVSSGLPSTTASALASITTGCDSGEHGLLGYQVRDPKRDVLVNHLKPYPPGVVASQWQPRPTLFELVGERGLPSIAVGEERFEGTDLSESILRGAQFVGSYSLDQHLQAYRSFGDHHNDGLAYLYWPAVDRMGHQRGVDSVAWVDALESVDQFVATLQEMIRPDEEVLIVADHGMVDVRSEHHWVMSSGDPLRSAIAHWGGEPRCVHLYLHEPGESDALQLELQRQLGDRGRVLNRDQCVSLLLFGTVSPEHRGRIGDLVVFAEGAYALYDEETASAQSLQMVGQHGSWTPVETRVPAIRLRSLTP